MAWKGVILEQSLKEKSLIEEADIVKTEEMSLEGESRDVKLHKFSLSDEEKEDFVGKAERCLKPEWYIHIVKDNSEMVVIYRNRSFQFKKEEKQKLNEARKYGKQQGILEEQLGFETLFENPWS